jgi:hypothetical protein
MVPGRNKKNCALNSASMKVEYGRILGNEPEEKRE